MRLNGWQRLFVLIAVFYLGLIVLLFVSVNSFPTRDYYYDQWSQTLMSYLTPADNKKFIDEVFRGSVPRPSEQRIPILEEKFSKNQSINDPFGDVICKETGSYKCAMDLRAKYTYLLNNVFNEQVKYVFAYFLLWFLPLLILYVFGWACGWVYKGFK